jgi:hypothetical protein
MALPRAYKALSLIQSSVLVLSPPTKNWSSCGCTCSVYGNTRQYMHYDAPTPFPPKHEHLVTIRQKTVWAWSWSRCNSWAQNV